MKFVTLVMIAVQAMWAATVSAQEVGPPLGLLRRAVTRQAAPIAASPTPSSSDDAQAVAPSTATFSGVIPGEAVEVYIRQGPVIRGVVMEVTASSLTLDMKGRQQMVRVDAVDRIVAERAEFRVPYTIIGLIRGAGIGLGVGSLVAIPRAMRNGEYQPGVLGVSVVGFAASGAIWGARSKVRRVVFQRCQGC
jgi:sRNA-binding regulator protein Hfq